MKNGTSWYARFAITNCHSTLRQFAWYARFAITNCHRTLRQRFKEISACRCGEHGARAETSEGTRPRWATVRVVVVVYCYPTKNHHGFATRKPRQRSHSVSNGSQWLANTKNENRIHKYNIQKISIMVDVPSMSMSYSASISPQPMPSKCIDTVKLCLSQKRLARRGADRLAVMRWIMGDWSYRFYKNWNNRHRDRHSKYAQWNTHILFLESWGLWRQDST